MNYVYPHPDECVTDPEDLLSDQEIADVIVDYRENGHTKIRAELEALGICHNKAAVKRVSQALDEEVSALNAISPSTFKSEGEFLAALASKCKFLDAATWLACLKDKSAVLSFADLVAKVARI